MLEVFRNAWRIPDLRKKILFTVFIIVVYRFGAQIQVPFVDVAVFSQAFLSQAGGIFGMFDMMSGGAFSRSTIFALSIQPYINASIIMQLLTVGIPALERMQKEGGEEGRKKIASITRYATVGLALLMGFGYFTYINSIDGALVGAAEGNFWCGAVIVLSFTAGSAFIMWLGEQVTEFGVGNGISIILFASIVSRGPSMVSAAVGLAQSNQWALLVGVVVAAVAAVVFVVFITNAERRVPIQYSKRMIGRKMYGGQSTHLPLKVNMSGVMPIIFAQAIASFPITIAAFISKEANDAVDRWFGYQSVLYIVVYFALIIGFAYFYQSIQFNPVEIANNLKQSAGFIPGFRPGRPTSDFIKKVLNKITLFGALFLGVIAVVPIVMSMFSDSLRGLALGGTSLLIVVGVALETVKAIEAQMVMRHHKGFLE
ncbi:MAG: preprotein translocase subunit SecY [Oscillospiraceae bacterium]|jgi:preprotein translocase subunit SecY|nr:preprotein translocase subunit SecY [Oscillospiraceae bacterium]